MLITILKMVFRCIISYVTCLYRINAQLWYLTGDLEHIYYSFPRVEYDNIILSPAKWTVSYEEIQDLCLQRNNPKLLLKEIKKWQQTRSIPDWIKWVVSDNKLVLDLQNYDMCLLFLETLERKKSITIEEFLSNENEVFVNEYIFTAYKTINGD